MWTVALLASAAVLATSIVAVRCWRAGRLIDRILAEELGPQRLAEPVPGDQPLRRQPR